MKRFFNNGRRMNIIGCTLLGAILISLFSVGFSTWVVKGTVNEDVEVSSGFVFDSNSMFQYIRPSIREKAEIRASGISQNGISSKKLIFRTNFIFTLTNDLKTYIKDNENTLSIFVSYTLLNDLDFMISKYLTAKPTLNYDFTEKNLSKTLRYKSQTILNEDTQTISGTIKHTCDTNFLKRDSYMFSTAFTFDFSSALDFETEVYNVFPEDGLSFNAHLEVKENE